MTTNEKIASLLGGLEIDNVQVPVAQGFYFGSEEIYVTYNLIGRSVPLCADDGFAEVEELIDFDIYSKGDLVKVENAIKPLLEAGDFEWRPSQSSGDLYEHDTGYHHRTLCFAHLTEQEENKHG